MAPGGQAGNADVVHGDHAGERFRVDQAEATGYAHGAAHGGQNVVDGGGLGFGFDECRAQGGDVLATNCSPSDGERARGEPAGQNLRGAVEGNAAGRGARQQRACWPGRPGPDPGRAELVRTRSERAHSASGQSRAFPASRAPWAKAFSSAPYPFSLLLFQMRPGAKIAGIKLKTVEYNEPCLLQ